MIIKPKMLLFISAGLMTREIGFVNVKTISGYRKSNELFNWAKGASVDMYIFWRSIFGDFTSFIY